MLTGIGVRRNCRYAATDSKEVKGALFEMAAHRTLESRETLEKRNLRGKRIDRFSEVHVVLLYANLKVFMESELWHKFAYSLSVSLLEEKRPKVGYAIRMRLAPRMQAFDGTLMKNR